MAGERSTTFWPLFDLVVRTPRLELRLPREEEFGDVIALVDAGIHDPDTMPFFIPWTDVEPRRRAREAAQWMWRHRANWSPDGWTLTCGVFVDGKPVGMQDLGATHFSAVRSVETGSWLGQAHQGQGLGREMREAVLHLAFGGLGAEEALSGAFEDNLPRSRRRVPWGTRKTERRGGIAATARAAPSGSAWDGRPGRSDVAPTLRSSGSRSASICSWARPD